MTTIQKEDWCTFKSFSWYVTRTISVRNLRTYIKNREQNGANYWCKKLCGRLYLSPSRFYQWLEKEGKL